MPLGSSLGLFLLPLYQIVAMEIIRIDPFISREYFEVHMGLDEFMNSRVVPVEIVPQAAPGRGWVYNKSTLKVQLNSVSFEGSGDSDIELIRLGTIGPFIQYTAALPLAGLDTDFGGAPLFGVDKDVSNGAPIMFTHNTAITGGDPNAKLVLGLWLDLVNMPEVNE